MIGNLIFGNSVNCSLQNQLLEQLPIFVAAWERDAPILFEQIFSVFKIGFKNKKRTAIIYLSHNASYGSNHFFILGLRYYLDPEPWVLSVSREDCFTSLVLHELLHIWVDENIGSKSSLLIKYRNEHSDVLDHIHLMAIQKMVYLKLNRPDMLKMLDESYRKLSSPEYRRAWEIVNDIEGHEAVLKDILNELK